MMAFYLSASKTAQTQLSPLHSTVSIMYFSSALADTLRRTGSSLEEKFTASVICELTRKFWCKFTTTVPVRKWFHSRSPGNNFNFIKFVGHSPSNKGLMIRLFFPVFFFSRQTELTSMRPKV